MNESRMLGPLVNFIQHLHVIKSQQQHLQDNCYIFAPLEKTASNQLRFYARYFVLINFVYRTIEDYRRY